MPWVGVRMTPAGGKYKRRRRGEDRGRGQERDLRPAGGCEDTVEGKNRDGKTQRRFLGSQRETKRQ